jgi:hypothetical protein
VCRGRHPQTPAPGDWLAAPAEITTAPETAVLMFTAFAERSLPARGLSRAPRAILKEAPHQTIVRAIRRWPMVMVRRLALMPRS